MFLGCGFFNRNRFASPVFCLLNRFGFCHCSQLVWEFPQPCQQSAFRSLTDCIPFPTLQNPDHSLFFSSGSFFLPNRQQSLCFLFPAAAECCNWTFLTVRKCWEGLGYYTRAKNLQRAAQQIRTISRRIPDQARRSSFTGWNRGIYSWGDLFDLLRTANAGGRWKRTSSRDAVAGCI